MRKFIKVLTLFFLTSSCALKTQDVQYSHHDDGSAKPKIALLPVIDSAHSQMNLDLSKVFTEGIFSSFHQTNRFFITDEFDLLATACFADPGQNPFLEDLEWIKEMNASTEFLILVELLEHKLIPKSPVGKFFNLQLVQSYTLDMSVRIKVIDIRFQKTKVILQEIIHRSFHIPWKVTAPDPNSAWSKTAFALSPIGMAHSEMIQRISLQIQDYILLAKINK